MSLDDIDIEHWLMLHDYKTIEDWALHIGCHYDKHYDVWSLEGKRVDLEDELGRLIQEEINAHE